MDCLKAANCKCEVGKYEICDTCHISHGVELGQNPQTEQATASCLSELLATTQEWLPIGTAPKDGTVFIAPFGDWSGYVNCRWMKEGSFEGWIDVDDGDVVNPSHWIPLPHRPKAG